VELLGSVHLVPESEVEVVRPHQEESVEVVLEVEARALERRDIVEAERSLPEGAARRLERIEDLALTDVVVEVVFAAREKPVIQPEQVKIRAEIQLGGYAPFLPPRPYLRCVGARVEDSLAGAGGPRIGHDADIRADEALAVRVALRVADAPRPFGPHVLRELVLDRIAVDERLVLVGLNAAPRIDPREIVLVVDAGVIELVQQIDLVAEELVPEVELTVVAGVLIPVEPNVPLAPRVVEVVGDIRTETVQAAAQVALFRIGVRLHLEAHRLGADLRSDLHEAGCEIPIFYGRNARDDLDARHVIRGDGT
jgi:hypothetical protein